MPLKHLGHFTLNALKDHFTPAAYPLLIAVRFQVLILQSKGANPDSSSCFSINGWQKNKHTPCLQILVVNQEYLQSFILY